MSSSPAQTNESPSYLITPKNSDAYQQRHLLSPPPAPSGWAYVESDVLTNSCGNNTEQRQSNNSRENTTIPMLDSPPATSSFHSSSISPNTQQNEPSTPSNSSNLPIRRRRANSSDGIAQTRITLRPRFALHHPFNRSLIRRDDVSPDHPDADFQHLRLHSGGQGSDRDNRPCHLRSHTDSSFFDEFLHQTSFYSNEPLPGFPRSLFNPSTVKIGDEQQFQPAGRREGEKLSPTSPPKSNFGFPNDLRNEVPRPIPRYSQGGKSQSPPREKRFCTGNASEVTTTCTLSSSNNSAFVTPLKFSKNPTSPLTSVSDSKTLEEESLDVGDDDSNPNNSNDFSHKVLPYIPQCDETQLRSE